MCGRFAAPRDAGEILSELDLEPAEFLPGKEIFPTNQVLAIFSDVEGNQAKQMIWGWQRKFTKRPLINVRGPEAWSKPTWAGAMHSGRCLVPASSFYEWDQNQPKGKRDRYEIKMAHGDDFAMGGLYETDTSSGESFVSILTTSPNQKMAVVHHRMPVIIPVGELSKWLSTDDQAEVDKLMSPLPDSDIELLAC